jgi:hypothetical protein
VARELARVCFATARTPTPPRRTSHPPRGNLDTLQLKTLASQFAANESGITLAKISALF